MRRILFAALLTVWWTPGWAASFALVVGINDYQHAGPLQGAVADAEHMAEALRGAGATDVLVLTDQDATRIAIAAAWHDLVWQTEPGDTLIFSFAGRAARTTTCCWRALAKPVRATANASPEINCSRGSPRPPGARCCSSVTQAMARRFTAHGPITDDAAPAAEARTIQDLPHVAMLLAGGYGELIPEVMIDGVPRGALSWTAARALGGRADADGNGALTLGEVADYVVEIVRVLSERRHHPRLLTMAPRSSVIMELPAGHATAPEKADWVGVYVLGVENEDAQTLRYTVGPSVVLSASVPHQLIWDADKLQMLSTFGDVVATLAKDDIRQLRRVIDKWNLVAVVRGLSERRGLRLRLDTGDGLYRADSPTQLNVPMDGGPFLTLFNIAADGTTKFLFPHISASLGGDENLLKVPGNKDYVATLDAGPPYGADHLIAITSTTALTGLHGTLRLIHGKPAPKLLKKALIRALDGADYRIGIHARYTAP